ncbi:uncharacterized protein [Mobula birostris]|uniref:uncharacterized protein isoform X1 n=2 Tax=Mobula birostris TaxID=1983395 RepID=UPI003B281C02
MAGSPEASAGQYWPPSRVQVTVLRARALRAKGKQGSSDSFTIIQLGKERFCTEVVERSLEPVWREECCFDLPPGWLETGAALQLQLTVHHRSLMGLDKFLGQLTLPLAAAYEDSSKKPRWYKLSSKPGQKEKERGEIQVSIQFVRNNLTASMFDLSSKEKHRSALDKLKDKVKGKKRHESLSVESASAIVPSSVIQITSDEEFSEKGTPEKKSKKSFFSKHKLQRSSLTKSNTSLSSQQSVKSLESMSSNTGITNLPSPKSTTAPGIFHPPQTKPIDTNPSLAKILKHKRALSDEVNQALISNMDHLTPKTSPISRSLVCINGSHIYSEEHSSNSTSSLFPKSSSLSRSFQGVAAKAGEPGRRNSFTGPNKKQGEVGNGENPEFKMAPPVITVNDEVQVLGTEGRKKEAVGSAQGTKPVHIAAPIMSTVEPTINSAPPQAKRSGILLFGSDSKDSEARRSRTPSPVRKSSSLAEKTKHSGWFQKEANHRPSLNFGAQEMSDASMPSPSTAGSIGRGWSAVEASAAEELIPPPSTPASAAATASASCIHVLDPSAMFSPPVVPDIAKQSAAFLSPGLDAEVKDQEVLSQWMPTSAVPVGDSSVQVASTVPGEIKAASPEEGDCSSTLVQRAELNVKMSPLVAQVHAWPKSGSCPMNLSGSRTEDDESSNVIGDSEATVDADLKTHSVLNTLPPAVPPMMQNSTFGDKGLETKASLDSLTAHLEEIPGERPGQSDADMSSVQPEGGRSVSDTASEAESELQVVPTSLDKARGDVCPDSPPVLFDRVGVGCEGGLEGRSQDAAMPHEEQPQLSADQRNVIPHLTGPPPPKPPRLLVYTSQAKGDGDRPGMPEDRREIMMPFGCVATALQLSEQQVDRGFEQRASLVVSSPAADEVNPERTDSSSTPSDAEEPVRPSNEVVTKGKASCGTFELSLNESTGFEHYKTCLSKLSAEGIDVSSGSNENSNKLDVFQQTPSLGLIEVHQACQLVKIQPAALKTTAGVNSEETVSVVEESLLTGLERRETLPERQSGVAWPDQTDHLEQVFLSAIESLTGTSDPPLNEREASREEFSGELKTQVDDGTGKEGEPSAQRNSMEVLTMKMERGCQQAEAASLEAGIGPSLCSEPLTAGIEMEQHIGGVTCVLEPCAGGENSALKQSGEGEELTLERPARGEQFASGQWPKGGELLLGQRGSEEEFVSQQQPGEEEPFVAENFPTASCPPLTVKPNQGRVTGKAGILPHGGNLSADNADVQAFNGQKPEVQGDSSAGSVRLSAGSETSFEEGRSFKDLHLQSAPPPLHATNLTVERMGPPARSNKPVAFSTPHPVAVTNPRVTDLPSPILPPSNGAPPPGATQRSLQSGGSNVAPLTVLPRETRPAEIPFPQQRISPHPVKPITATTLEMTEKKSGRSCISNTLSSGLEKLKIVTTGNSSPGKFPVAWQEDREEVKESKVVDPAEHYYHLTHDELIKKVLQQESELRKKEEHVRDLEEYIDLLLVQIMEQNPSILQSVSEKMKNKALTK